MIGRWLALHGFLLLKLGVLLLLAASAVDDGIESALAQGETDFPSEPTSEEEDETPPVDLPGHLPFTPWAEGADEAIPFEALPPAEQDAVMEQARRSETNAGYDVAHEWSAYSHEMAARVAAETAGRLAGLTGTDEIGVAP